MAPSEGTPLLQDPIIGFERRPWYLTLSCILQGTLLRHWISFVGSFLSAGSCVVAGWASYAMFDALFFKSVFVFFGFAIGFRNVRAHARRSGALTSVRGMFHAVWDIIVLFPDETREELAEDLIAACAAIANYITLVASRSDCNYALAGLEPEYKEERWCTGCCGCEFVEDEEEGCRALNVGPSTLVAATFLKCEDEVDRLTKLASIDTQKYRRTFWAKKGAFDKEYGILVDLAIPSVSDAYAMQINLCLFVFCTLLPWGLQCQAVTYHGKVVVTAGTFLMLNTLLVDFILLGLNALAAEQEDPFQHGHMQLDIMNLVTAFRRAIEGYEKRRRKCTPKRSVIEEVEGSKEQDLLALHHMICGKHKDEPPLMRSSTVKFLPF